MSVRFDSGCQTPLRACKQSALRVRGCRGGIFLSGQIIYSVKPNDEEKPVYIIEHQLLTAFVNGRIYYLTNRFKGDPEEGQGLEAYKTSVDAVRSWTVSLFKKNLHITHLVETEAPTEDTADVYAATHGYLGDGSEIIEEEEVIGHRPRMILNINNTFINSNIGSSHAYCELEDILIVTGDGYFPSITANPNTRNICKITSVDEEYQSVGAFTFPHVVGVPFIKSPAARLAKWKDTVAVTDFVQQDINTPHIAKYVGGDSWEVLDVATDPRTVSGFESAEGSMVHIKMLIKGLDGEDQDKKVIDYLFTGGNFLWVFSDEFKWQKLVSPVIPIGFPATAFTDPTPYRKGVVFLGKADTVEYGAIKNQPIYFDGKKYIAMGDLTNPDDKQPDIISGHIGVGTDADEITIYATHNDEAPESHERLNLVRYSHSKNLWESVVRGFGRPNPKDGKIISMNQTGGTITPIPKKFTFKEPKLGGDDWELDQVPVVTVVP